MSKASIQRKGNVYYVVFRDPSTRKQKWLAAGTTKRGADVLRNEIEGQLLRGEYRTLKKATFNEFSELWLSDYPPTRNMKPSTLRDYRSALRCHFQPHFGDTLLESITLEDLERFVSRKLVAGMSARRMADILVPVKTMFKSAVRWGYLRTNPAAELVKPRFDTPEMDFLTPEEGKRLLSAVDEYHRAMVMFALMTGVRPGELVAIRWKDIELASKTVSVRYTLDRGELLSPKTENARRRIPIPDELVRELEKHRARWKQNPKDLVFVQQHSGAPIDLSNFRNRVFHHALEKAGLRRVRLYDLRHSYAAWMISVGVEPLQLSRNLGHYDLGFTYKTYGHLMPASGHDEAARLGSLLKDGHEDERVE